jgi:AraC-like DNA-binding protein
MLRKKVLLAGDGFAVAVCRYAPGERHGVHTDTHSRISFLIGGGYREEGRPGAIRMLPGHVLLKSRRAKHEDQFGPDGAQIAAIEFIDDDPFDQSASPDLWRQRVDGFALRHATAFLESGLAGDRHAARTAGFDLVAGSGEASSRRTDAPAWLSRLREELEEHSLASVDVAAQAKDAGAHPAHASRLFRRCYGASITQHAQAHSVRRAMAPLASGASLSEVALAAGFYDQSHMTRVFRRVTGRTPGAHRAMFAAAMG